MKVAAEWPRRFTPLAPVGPVTDLRQVDLIAAEPLAEALPSDPAVRGRWLRSLARDAVIYGLPAALQYANLHQTVLHPQDGEFTSWRHDRQLAVPGYAAFRTPNIDTLYSSAWLDLTGGPVELVVPAMGDRYYTVNLLDAHSNAVNIGTRTLGPGGGRVWITAPDRPVEDVPPDVRVLRAGTPYLWALMRIFVRSADDVATVRQLQDRVLLRRPEEAACSIPAASPRPWPAAGDMQDGATVLAALDEVLRRNGHPVQEDALLARLRVLGIGGPDPLCPDEWPDEVRAAVEAGHGDAMELVRSVVALRGRPAGESGWRLLSSGAYGYNYLHRAATNFVGLGGNTREESGPYTTLLDRDGAPLDGSQASYLLRFRPPPVDAFWSLTLYDLNSRGLVENPLDRYGINTLTEGLVWEPDGSLLIDVGTTSTVAGANWLPAPAAPFYLVLRAYLGHPEVLDGSWAPCSVERDG